MKDDFQRNYLRQDKDGFMLSYFRLCRRPGIDVPEEILKESVCEMED